MLRPLSCYMYALDLSPTNRKDHCVEWSNGVIELRTLCDRKKKKTSNVFPRTYAGSRRPDNVYTIYRNRHICARKLSLPSLRYSNSPLRRESSAALNTASVVKKT